MPCPSNFYQMNIRFLGQGFADISDESVGQLIIDLLENEAFNQFTAIVAFASEAGVSSVIEHIKSAEKHLTQIEFYIGIDQQATSYEALNLLLDSNLNCYIYHTVSHIIFHPKIYIFEGEKQGKIIIGSSNLTLQGLFQNMEASLVIDFEMNDKQGINLLNQIKNYYRFLLDKTALNVQQLTQDLIKQLTDAEVIPKEKERREVSNTTNKTPQNQDLFSEVKKMFPSVNIPKRKTKPQKKKPQKSAQKTTLSKGKQTLVWQKKNLPSSDAQQVSGKTNPTGVLRLAQARFKLNDTLIDFKTYFRNEVFDRLDWAQKTRVQNSPLEEVHTDFQIEIDGVSKGIFNLRISHDSDRVAGQNNVPTTLHWGDAIGAIREQNIKGKTLSLFQIEGETNLFLIKIE